MSTYSVGHTDPETGIGWKAFALFAGFLIPFVIAIVPGSPSPRTTSIRLASDSFDEGIDLDTILVGLQLALFVFALANSRRVQSQTPISNSRRTSFKLVLRSVFSLRQPTTSAQETWNVPAGNSLGRVPGTTTARGGT